MKKKLIIIFLFTLVLKAWIFSQTILTGNLYFNNKYTINPAYAGELNSLNAFVDYRNTSSSIAGSPKLIVFGANMPVYRKMSLGVRFNKQSEGLFDILSAYADYSYWLKLTNGQTLRFGISTGVNSNQIDYSKIIAEDPSAIIDVASRNFVGAFFQVAAGFVYNWNNFEWSISMPQLLESKNQIKLDYQSLMLYNIKFSNRNLILKPSVFVIYRSNSPVLFDINLQCIWKEFYWLGLGYRNRPGIFASAGFKVKDINLAYSIELGSEKYSNMFKQIHEISISYTFQKRKKIRNDSILVNDNPLVLKTDSTSKDTSHLVINNLISDTTVKSQNELPKYKVDNAGSGIFVVKSLTIDTTQIIRNGNETNAKSDSLLLDKLSNEITKKDNNNKIMLVEEGTGVYNLKTFNIDSISKGKEITDGLLDSIIESNDLLNQINMPDNDTNSDENLKAWYTIQLFINDSNIYLLTIPEIVDQARIEKLNNGEFGYFYGYFDSEDEGNEVVKKLKKYKDLNVNVLKINRFD